MIMKEQKSMLPNFICIEGNIGAGKTTLAKKIAAEFGARLILEEFDNNPFLPKFYKDPEKYAFPLELFFMAERYKQLQHITTQDLFSTLTVSDYFFIKSKLFAQNNLKEDELHLFYRLFDIMLAALPKPELMIYLYADIDRLQSNIQKRGRDFEQAIDNAYLQNIQNRYLDYFNKQTDFPVLLIDITHIDLLTDDINFRKIINAIQKEHKKELYKVAL